VSDKHARNWKSVPEVDVFVIERELVVRILSLSMLSKKVEESRYKFEIVVLFGSSSESTLLKSKDPDVEIWYLRICVFKELVIPSFVSPPKK
jgi:hypothetical protein